MLLAGDAERSNRLPPCSLKSLLHRGTQSLHPPLRLLLSGSAGTLDQRMGGVPAPQGLTIVAQQQSLGPLRAAVNPYIHKSPSFSQPQKIAGQGFFSVQK
jgi:hypothetical protein